MSSNRARDNDEGLMETSVPSSYGKSNRAGAEEQDKCEEEQEEIFQYDEVPSQAIQENIALGNETLRSVTLASEGQPVDPAEDDGPTYQRFPTSDGGDSRGWGARYAPRTFHYKRAIQLGLQGRHPDTCYSWPPKAAQCFFPQVQEFSGTCYRCEGPNHSQHYCWLQFCTRCRNYGHSARKCMQVEDCSDGVPDYPLPPSPPRNSPNGFYPNSALHSLRLSTGPEKNAAAPASETQPSVDGQVDHLPKAGDDAGSFDEAVEVSEQSNTEKQRQAGRVSTLSAAWVRGGEDTPGYAAFRRNKPRGGDGAAVSKTPVRTSRQFFTGFNLSDSTSRRGEGAWR